jgi:hypothetical protein
MNIVGAGRDAKFVVDRIAERATATSPRQAAEPATA